MIFLSDTPFFSPTLRVRLKKVERNLWYSRFFPRKDALSVRLFLLILQKRLGKRRFIEIENRLKINFTKLPYLKESLVAKFLMLYYDITRNDMQEALMRKDDLTAISSDLKRWLDGFSHVEDLDAETFSVLYERLKSPLEPLAFVKLRAETFFEKIVDLLRSFFSVFYFNSYYSLKKRLQESIKNPQLSLEGFYEKLAMFYAGSEDLRVGTLIPGPRIGKKVAFYRVAAILVTAKGQHGLILMPPPYLNDQLPIRITKGTPYTISGLDFLSYVITDLEKEIGKTGFYSGEPYQKEINQITKGPVIEIGFSVGGTMAMWRTAHHLDLVSELWTFRSPGAPSHVVDLFNHKAAIDSRDFDVYVYHAKGDIIRRLGEQALGYKAPVNVRRYLCIVSAKAFNPHIEAVLSSDNSYSKVEVRGDINTVLDNLHQPFFEYSRKAVGGTFLCPILQLIKKARDFFIVVREEQIKGLWYESPSSNLWGIKRVIK
jgi:hypothetical protein